VKAAASLLRDDAGAPDRALIDALKGAFAAFAQRVNLVIAIDHSGRAGNGFFQAIFDQHPQVLTCPWVHYLYSYVVTEFGDGGTLATDAAHRFLTGKAYFRYLYNDVDARMDRDIRKFGGDPSAEIDRAAVRRLFDALLADHDQVERRTAILAMYFAYAVGVGRQIDDIRYVLVTDAISLRFESPATGFSGRVLDRVVEDFPAARIVHLVRDPRASFASTNHQFVNAWGNMYGVHWGNYRESLRRLLRSHFDWEGGFAFGFFALFFREAYLAAERQAARYRAQVRRVRNEDLNLDFMPTITGLCEWLGVGMVPEWSGSDYVPTMVGHPWTGTGAYNSTYQTNRHGPLRNDPDDVARKVSGPNAYVTRRWRTRLAPREIYLVECLLRDEIARYGYDFVASPAGRRSMLGFLGRLALPLRGELPAPRWILDGRHVGWREVADRLFFALTFLPFYVGARLAFLRLVHQKGLFPRP
jgi:hypothetical protein